MYMTWYMLFDFDDTQKIDSPLQWLLTRIYRNDSTNAIGNGKIVGTFANVSVYTKVVVRGRGI